MLSEGQKVLVGAKGLNEVQRVFSGRARSRSCSGEREVGFASETRTVTTRLIEGEFPNYEQLIPSGYPNRLTVVAGRPGGGGAAMQIVGQRQRTPRSAWR